MNNDLKKLLVSRLISSIGDQFYNIAIAITLFKKTNSILITTSIMVFKGLVSLFGIFFYRTTSIIFQKKIAILSDFTRFFLMLLIVYLLTVNYLYIYFIILILEIIQLYYSPSRIVLINNAINNENKEKINNYDQIVTTLAVSVGTLFGGIITYHLGYVYAIILNGFTFLISGFLILSTKNITLSINEIEKKVKLGFFKWEEINNFTILKRVKLIIGAFFYGPVTAFNSMILIFILTKLNLTAQYYGYSEGGMAIGLFLGSIFSLKIPSTKIENFIYLSPILMGILYLVSISGLSYIILFISLFLSAIFNMIYSCSFRNQFVKEFSKKDLGIIWVAYKGFSNIFSSLSVLYFSYLADKHDVIFSQKLSAYGVLLVGIVLFYFIKFPKNFC